MGWMAERRLFHFWKKAGLRYPERAPKYLSKIDATLDPLDLLCSRVALS
jgi:hypothetical protein